MAGTRLEKHREEFHQGKRLGNLVRLEDLSTDELTLVNSSLLNHMRLSDAEDLDGFYEVYVQTLHDWGIMCPHPLPRRLYDGWRRSEAPTPFNESKWYHCTLCRTSVINR